MKHWADGGETSLKNTLLLCRRHHRTVHEGRVKVSVNSDGTVLFFTPAGKMLADAPRKPEAARRRGRKEMVAPSAGFGGGLAGQSASPLPAVPTVHPGAPREGGYPTLLNGAALYRDSDIPWKIEAAAREAVEESLA